MSNILHYLFGSFGLMMSPVWREGRNRWLIPTVIVATVAVGGTALGPGIPVIGSGGGGGVGSANIWVDTSGGTCNDSTSLVSYTDSGACATLQAAVATAEPGDTINIKAGDYPFETVPYKSTLKDLSPGCDPYGEWGTISITNCVHILNDGDVKIRGMSIGASSLWLEGTMTGDIGTLSVAEFDNRVFGFHISNEDLIGNPPAGAATDAACNCASSTFQVKPSDSSTTAQRPDHDILDKLDTDTMVANSTDYLYVKDLDVGPLWVDTPTRGVAPGSPGIPTYRKTGSAGVNTFSTLVSTFFHEINRTYWCDVNNACHPDGLYIIGGTDYSIRKIGLSQITGEVLFFENSGNSGLPNVTRLLMENSWAGCKVNAYPDDPANARTTCGSSSTPFDIKNCGDTTGCTDMLFRYNSFYATAGAETQYTNVRMVGNASRQTGVELCPGAIWQYNAFWLRGGANDCNTTPSGNNINTGSSLPTSLWVNTTPGSEDFHLTGSAGSTIADNMVTPTTSDFTLTTDADGDPRTSGSRDAGADER